METPKQVGIWIRVSTEDQARGDSPEHHEKRAQYYAESKGWEVREVYHLEAVSGKAVMNHPEAQRMLTDIRSGRITGLIFSKLARLARSTKELLEFADIFRDNGTDLISLQESIDTSTPAGRLFYTMIAAMAQWEREEIADRVAASIPIRAKLGKHTGGQASLGYRWENNQLIVDPVEAPVRKLIYELFLQHRRKKTVARLLNEAGYRTRGGQAFSDTTVGRLLRNPNAKGIHRANFTKSQGHDKPWALKPEEEWVFVNIEPVVAEEIWDQCNAILDDQEKKNKRPARRPVQLFAGQTFCNCGAKMYVPSNTPKYVCAKCRNKIGITDLEELFHEQLKSFFFSPVEISQYLERADQTVHDKDELLQTLYTEERRLRAEMDQVYRLYIDKLITPNGFGDRYKPMEERLAQIDEQIPEVQAEIDFLKIQFKSSDQILSESKDLFTRWPQLAQSEKREIIESITERITIHKDEVIINLCYLPSSSELMATKQRCG
ncbi:MAG TPA: recombinase family protein [Armatimonadota bacterium]|jgi:site-specific DNA recombinase